MGRIATVSVTPADLRLLTYFYLVPGKHSINWLITQTLTGRDAVIAARKRLEANEWLDRYGDVTEVGQRHLSPILTEPWMVKHRRLEPNQTLLAEPWTDERAWGLRGLIVVRMAHEANERYLRAPMVAEWLGVDQNTTRALMHRWEKKDLVVKSGRGEFGIICNPFDGGSHADTTPLAPLLAVEARVERAQARMDARQMERIEWERAQFGPDHCREEALRAFEDFEFKRAH